MDWIGRVNNGANKKKGREIGRKILFFLSCTPELIDSSETWETSLRIYIERL
jgi:hypothetical protein